MRPNRPHSSRVLLSVALWWPIACAGPTAPALDSAAESHPTLWHARGPDGGESFYLLGSVHLGRRSTLAMPASVDEAFARSDELVLEIDLAELSPEDAASLTRRFALIEPPPTLRDRVSPDTLARLERYLSERGEALDPYLSFEPWFLATHLTSREALRLGLDPEYGVDRYFAKRAAGAKPTIGLETARSQLELMSGLPGDVQETMLVDALERTEDLRDETEALVDAWERGDDAALERIAFRPLRESPELAVFYERIMFDRNERMALRLAGLARDGKLRFVVIGAAHLIGERGIPALLRDYGFRLRVVQ